MKETNKSRQLHRESQIDCLLNLPVENGVRTSERLTDAVQHTMLYADFLGLQLKKRPRFSAWAELHQVEKIYTRMNVMNLTLTLAMTDRLSGAFAASAAGGAATDEKKMCDRWKSAVDETTQKIGEAAKQIESFERDKWILRPAIPNMTSIITSVGVVGYVLCMGAYMVDFAPSAGVFPFIGAVAAPMAMIGCYGHTVTYGLLAMRGAHDRRRAGSALFSVAMNAYLDGFDRMAALDALPEPLAIYPKKLTLEAQCVEADLRWRKTRRRVMHDLHKGCKALNS